MSLDTKQKRGSAISIGLPYRQWLSDPDGTLDSADRVALLKLCSAIAPAAPVTPNPVFLAASIRGPQNSGVVRG